MKTIDIYASGAIAGKDFSGRGGIGAVIVSPSDGIFRIAETYLSSTKPRMDILSAAHALERVFQGVSLEDVDHVRLYTDNAAICKVMNTDTYIWRNEDLWERLHTAVAKIGIPVRFHLCSFYKHPFSNEADELARGASLVHDPDTGASAVILEDAGFESLPERKKAKPSIDKVVLEGYSRVSNREIAVHLSDGSVVTVHGVASGFSLSGGSGTDALALATKVANRLRDWLHGGEL